jgi:hypothetical protein
MSNGAETVAVRLTSESKMVMEVCVISIVAVVEFPVIVRN